ncbi:DUF4013 domain-containing protein, partial [bacterium]|nr:DUF4013 domain-containing protein [bacterium]
EWSNAGDFTLKGILSACIAIVYGTVATVLCVFVGLIFGVKTFGEVVTGSEVHVSIIAKLLIPLVIYAISLLFWSAYSLYAETVELSRAFRMVEVVLRVQALGKGMLISVAIWCASIGLVSWLTGLIPWSFLGYALLLLFVAYASLTMVHIVSQLSMKYVKPVLGDVVNVGYMEYSLKQRAEESKFEDEYGHQKQGGRKASHYADHHPDEALTWSTDSDSPEL